MPNNKLGITNEIELAKEEERITKLKALELFDSNIINTFEVGTTKVCVLFIDSYLKIFIHSSAK